MEDLRKYNESAYYDCVDIAEKLTAFPGTEDKEIKEELTEAIYQITAMAENPYNSDRWRILYNVLLKFAETED